MTLDLALAIEAIAARDGDPLTRFIRSLSDDAPIRLRSFAEDTRRLREELIQHVQDGLTETNPQQAAAHGAWIAQHAPEVLYRWSSLMRAVQAWTQRDVEAVSFRITRSVPDQGVVADTRSATDKLATVSDKREVKS